MPPSTNSSISVMKLQSSDARNRAAFATSSGVPIRPIGTAAMTFALNSSSCSLVPPAMLPPGVSIGPGLMAFTRILWLPQVRGPTARERPHSGLAGTVNTGKYRPFGRRERGGQNDRSAVREERQRLLHGEEYSFDVDVEQVVEVVLRDRPERGQRQEAGVGEQDVDATLLPFHRGEQPVEVREVGDVARHAGDVLADLPDRLIEFRLAAAGDEDVGPLGDKPPGGGQADAAVASG